MQSHCLLEIRYTNTLADNPGMGATSGMLPINGFTIPQRMSSDEVANAPGRRFSLFASDEVLSKLARSNQLLRLCKFRFSF